MTEDCDTTKTPARVVDGSGWPASLTRVVAGQVRRYRDLRGKSAEQLADDLTRSGLPYTRAQVTNLEVGRRDTVSVGELLAFAATLDVAPAALLTGTGASPVPLLPGRPVDPWTAFAWFARRPTGDDGAVLNVYRRHAEAVDHVRVALTAAGSGAARRTADDPAAGWVATLVALRGDLTARGLALPPLADDVAAAVDVAEHDGAEDQP